MSFICDGSDMIVNAYSIEAMIGFSDLIIGPTK